MHPREHTHTIIFYFKSSIRYILCTSMPIMPQILSLQMTNQKKGRKINKTKQKQEKTAFLSLMMRVLQPEARHESQERNLGQTEIYLKTTQSEFLGIKFSSLCSSSSRSLRTERATWEQQGQAAFQRPTHNTSHSQCTEISCYLHQANPKVTVQDTFMNESRESCKLLPRNIQSRKGTAKISLFSPS